MKKIAKVLDGNAAVSEALRQINPDVFGFYPITPTSYIGEKYAKFVADGKVDTEFITAESEHAALSVCIGAAAAGGRAVTATASQGLSLMNEVIYNAAGLRLPIVLINGNRVIGAPLSIHCAHDDAMSVRDSGWIQFFAKNPQEAYHLTIMSFKIAEAVKIPVMICMDCFHTTHTQMNMEIFTDEAVAQFIGKTVAALNLLDDKNPLTVGTFTKPDYYQEIKYQQYLDLKESAKKIREIFATFSTKFEIPSPKNAAKLVEVHSQTKAKTAVVVMGSMFEVVKEIQKKSTSLPFALIRPKVFRPFLSTEIRDILSNFSKVLVMDRMSPSGAAFSPLGTEIAQAFANSPTEPTIKNVIYGLGSRELNQIEFISIIKNFDRLPSDQAEWISVRK